MATNPPFSPAPAKNPKGSITGFVLAIISLPLAAIGSALVHAHYKPTTPVTTTAQKVDEKVAAGTTHVISTLIALPFLVVGFAIATIAVVFVLVRLGKGLKIGALLFSAVSVLLSVWSFWLIIAAFSLIKAH